MRSEGNVSIWRTKSCSLFHDNAPAHRSVLVKDFLAKNNVTTLEHPPYSPDSAAADFLRVPQLKSTKKERHFCDATEITKNATEELKRLSLNSFHLRFQRLHSVCLYMGTILKEI